MLQYKSGSLSKIEITQINSILSEIVDIFGDFYITKDRLRLYIKENSHLLYEGVTKGNKVIWGDEGIILVDGYADNYPRKYVKILARNEEDANQLIKLLNWNLNEDIYAKVKKENPILKALQRNGFKFVGDRGKEILLCRKANLRKTFDLPKKEEGDK